MKSQEIISDEIIHANVRSSVQQAPHLAEAGGKLLNVRPHPDKFAERLQAFNNKSAGTSTVANERGADSNGPTSSNVKAPEHAGSILSGYSPYANYRGQPIVSPYILPGQQMTLQQFVNSMNGVNDKGIPQIPSQFAPMQNMQLQPAPELPMVEEEPLYVNAKQYHCIVRRRKQREKLEAKNQIMKRKRYLHESRHQHAVRRQRGAGGRFLPKDKTAVAAKTGTSKKAAPEKAAPEKAAPKANNSEKETKSA